MLLPNKGVNLLLKHTSSILNIFHFDFDSPNHFVSISDNSEIIEFLLVPEEDKIIEIEKFYIKRPDNELLKENGHKIRHLKHGQYHKITQLLQFDNFIALGYEDGLILVYQISKRQFENARMNSEKLNQNKSKNLNNEKERIGENENEENEELNNTNNKNEQGKHKIDYFNCFSLYYILLGHLEDIISLCYIPQIKILISSSLDHTVKIFDFTNGHLTHFFKFDFIINRIFYQNTSKTGEPKIILTLLSQSPIKVIVNLSTNPPIYNTHHFEHIDLIQLEKINDKFYGMNSKSIKILDKNYELEGTLICLNNINLLYFYKHKNDFLIVDNENMIRMVSFTIKTKDKVKEDNKNDKNKKKNPKNEEPQEEEEKTFESIIHSEYKFKVGEDDINGLFSVNNFIFAFCRDGSLYLINYDKIQESCENVRMKIEDELSKKMMEISAQTKKSKKGKKDKKDKAKKEKKEKKKK